MRPKKLPPIEYVRQHLSYLPESGELIRLKSKFRQSGVGKPAGQINAYGYRIIFIENACYFGHRLAWLFMTGDQPPDVIDHINGDRADNRWANLRAASPSLNLANTKMFAGNSTGFKGVQRMRGKK